MPKTNATPTPDQTATKTVAGEKMAEKKAVEATELDRDGRRYAVSSNRGQAHSRVRYREGTTAGKGCRFLD